jgi:uroporphyrinogen decarboxylase
VLEKITMTSRERVRTILSGKPADRCGFWLGMPHGDTWPIYRDYFGTQDHEQIRRQLGDDMRWIPADEAYKDPDGKGLFNQRRTGISEGSVPVFQDATDPGVVDSVEWPNPDYFDFTGTLDALRSAGDVYRASGMWSCFFHIVADYFGMQTYFMKMYTDPEVVDAVTERVCEFYLEANRRFFDAAGTEADAFFMGNDYGTQLDLIISPELIDRFIMPYTRELVGLARSRGYQVSHHCCGAVHKMIPRFIDAGVHGVHPLQSLARNMDAETLARDFKGQIAFIGGIDTQQLLVHGKPEEIKAEVRRVKRLLGPCLVVSPSHEALLPNVSPENVVSMAEAAREP